MSGVAPVQDPDSVFLRAALEKALLTPQEAEQTLGAARLQGRPVSAILVERGLMNQHIVQAVSRAVTSQLGPNPFGTAAQSTSPPPQGQVNPFAATLPPLEAGQVPRYLGDFEVQSELGRGGMGAVYLAVQRSLGRQVALKVLSPGFASTAQAVDRFLREARAAASIVHANVVTVFTGGTEAGRLFLAMELLRGGDAQQLLAREGGRLTERRALELARDCARGLTAIERAGLIHRDIKPANIFIAEDGAAKLADLGLARAQTGEDRMTQSGLIVGTPQFMSPEQADGAPDIDIRTDIYGIGASLYQLLTGRMPFEGNTALAVVSKVVNEPAPDPRGPAPHVSAATAELVLRCMAKGRDDRPRSAAAFLAELEALLATLAQVQTPAKAPAAPAKAADPTAWAPRSTAGAPKARPTIADEDDEEEEEEEEKPPASALPVIAVMGALGLVVLVGAGLLLAPRGPTPPEPPESPRVAAGTEVRPVPPRPATEAPPRPVTEATLKPPASTPPAPTETRPPPRPVATVPPTPPQPSVTEAPVVLPPPPPASEAPAPPTEAPPARPEPPPPPATEAAPNPATEAAPKAPVPAPAAASDRAPLAADDPRWVAIDDPRPGARKASTGASATPAGLVTLEPPRKGSATAVVERNGGLAPRVVAWLVRSVRLEEADKALLTFGVRSSAGAATESNPGDQPPGSLHLALQLLRRDGRLEVKGQALTRHRRRPAAVAIGKPFTISGLDPAAPGLAIEVGVDDARFRVVVLHGAGVVAFDETLAWGNEKDDERTAWAYAGLQGTNGEGAIDLAFDLSLRANEFLPQQEVNNNEPRDGRDGRPPLVPPPGGQQGGNGNGQNPPPNGPGPRGPGPNGPGPRRP